VSIVDDDPRTPRRRARIYASNAGASEGRPRCRSADLLRLTMGFWVSVTAASTPQRPYELTEERERSLSL
jgi:hypothetical protein